MQKFTVWEFNEMFPDEATCLDFIRDTIYPDGITCRKCERVTAHHRLTNRKCYSCQECGTHVYPLAGTIFAKSRTPLKSWFYAMFLLSSTRCGISAKQLQRELGVTYKTAWRMFHQLRMLLDQGDLVLSGTVEADEAFMGGQAKWKHEAKKPKGRHPRDHGPRGGFDRTPVFGMAKRGTKDADGKFVTHGKVRAVVVDSASSDDLLPHVAEKVLPASTVYTDEWTSYAGLEGMGYTHDRVNHTARVYVDGDVHTNTIEGFWALVKRGIAGVYHSVSTKHLQSYLDEYAFRYNHRDEDAPMYAVMGKAIPTVRHGQFGTYQPLGKK
jgi:transposase